jgi:ABC-type transporter Mla subunit MlaD
MWDASWVPASMPEIQRGRVALTNYELVARNVNDLNATVAGLNRQLDAMEQTSARLQETALDTAHTLSRITQRWDAVHDAMRRTEVDLGAH